MAAGRRYIEQELIDELARGLSADSPVHGEPRRSADLVDRALEHIEASLFEPFRIEHLAERIHTSSSSLLRAFRRELGQTPYAFVKTRRLDEAMNLLQQGEHQVQEIALLIGYDSLPAFSKAFRQRFGISPSKVRPPGA